MTPTIPTPKIAVVTGAAGGLGRAFTRRLMADGLHVVGVDLDAAALLTMAADLGPEGIRVNAISAGPMRTLAGSAIGSARRCSGGSSCRS